ncbi:MAG: hypothetical protein R2697_10295 [Ilumatobacteraceae bacterium]
MPRMTVSGVGQDDHLATGDDGAGLAGRHVAADAAVAGDRVVVLPPPLLTGDVDDAVGVVGVVEFDDRGDRRDGDAGEQHRRERDEHVLEPRLAVRLLGDRLTTVLELDDADRDDGHDDQADDAGDHEDRPLQIVDPLRFGARRVPGVLRRPAHTKAGTTAP